jgi:hypothetical protein
MGEVSSEVVRSNVWHDQLQTLEVVAMKFGIEGDQRIALQ